MLYAKLTITITETLLIIYSHGLSLTNASLRKEKRQKHALTELRASNNLCPLTF